jgi:hypothetical protein
MTFTPPPDPTNSPIPPVTKVVAGAYPYSSAVVNNLVLTEPQLEVLSELGIAKTDIYYIRGELLQGTLVKAQGYTNGQYVFFLEGNATEHAVFLRYLFGNEYKPQMPYRFRGLTVYGTPTQAFMKPEYKVTISSVSEPLVDYQ